MPAVRPRAQSPIIAAQCVFEWAWGRECRLSIPTDTLRDGTGPDEAKTRPPRPSAESCRGAPPTAENTHPARPYPNIS